MNQFLHLLETLESHVDRIRTDLGSDWPEFAAQVQSLAPAFETAQDETALAHAVGDLYMACRAREPLMAILRQTADTSGVGHERRPSAPDPDHAEEMLVREIVNRFQSLLVSLAEMERLEERENQSEYMSEPGAEDATDH